MTRLERVLVWSSTAAVAGTGLIYGAMKYLMRPTDEFAIVNHPLQPLVLKLHILIAPVLVFALGMIAVSHILPRLRSRRIRRTGLVASLVVAPLVPSGYLLQAITGVGALRVIGLAHLGLGIVFAIAAAGHARAARKRGRSATGIGVAPPGSTSEPRTPPGVGAVLARDHPHL
jgi:hypothetical protein